MTPLADMIPAMTDLDLASLHANASRLIQQGSLNQVSAASDILPVIEAETARRAALPKPPRPAPRKRTVAKKLDPVTGHQTALPAPVAA